MAGSTFWSSSDLEPKRQFKFLFLIPGNDEGTVIETYLIKSVNKPAVTIQTGATVNYIQHTFKYPGRLTWNDISVTLIDTIRVDDTSSRLANIIRQSGYVIPDDEANSRFSFTKRGAVNALNKPKIQQLDAGDPVNNVPPKVIEEWTLWNAWVNSVNFGGNLDYSGDQIVNVTLGITYDWAEYTTSDNGQINYDGTGGLQRLPGR
jgi:hypothetical protein